MGKGARTIRVIAQHARVRACSSPLSLSLFSFWYFWWLLVFSAVLSTGAYPGGRTPGGPSELLILAPSEMKNVALTPLPRSIWRVVKHVIVTLSRGGYLVERWVRGCAAQIGCFLGSQVLQWPLFYLKIGLDIGRVFAKCIISDEFVLWFIYRLSKSTYASQFTL